MKDFKECRLFSEYRLLYSANDEFPHTISFLIKLKDKINIQSLTFAINIVQKRYPYLCVELKKDENGYYFTKNNRDIILEDISKNITLNSPDSNYHLISFQYSKEDNFIKLNLSHAMTDGIMSYAIIRTLLYYYITKAYNVELSKENIRLIEDEIPEEEFDDPFLTFKKMIKPSFPKITTCLNVIKENKLENQKKLVYHLSINEKELMDFVKSIKATPGTLMLLLLSKSIKKQNINNTQPIMMNLCLDLRKIFNKPLSHQFQVSGILFDFDDKLNNLNIEEQIKSIREKVKEALQEPKSLETVSLEFNFLLMLANEKDENKIKQFQTMLINQPREIMTGNISYVGKANFGDAEKYITDFRTLAGSPIPVMIEIAAVNGKFYLDFIQDFEDDRYFKAFKEELEKLKINYEFIDVKELVLPKMKQII